MNLDELKAEWQQLNIKLSASQRLNDELILSMLKERSRSRVEKVKKNNSLFLVLMIINLVVLFAILIGNPFDFQYTLQYVPYWFLVAGTLLTIASLLKTFKSLSIDINSASLDNFLRKTTAEYEKNKRLEKWFGRLILGAGLLTAFSFLPKKLEHKALLPALAETALSIIITLTIYFIAFKLGAFKDRNREGFRNDLEEWDRLKQISAELND